jgi:hypothetical protein
VGQLYYILSTREAMARSLCDKQGAPDRDKDVAAKVQERFDTCVAQYSEVGRLRQMYEQRMVVQRAKKQQETEAAIAATARRTQQCQGISELQAQIAAKSRELGDARTKAAQADANTDGNWRRNGSRHGKPERGSSNDARSFRPRSESTLSQRSAGNLKRSCSRFRKLASPRADAMPVASR